jgi:hypothetical protein
LSRDPIEERGGPNLYGFVGNDPIIKRDLLGLTIRTQCPIDDWLLTLLDGYTRLGLGPFEYYDAIGGTDHPLKSLIVERMANSQTVFIPKTEPSETQNLIAHMNTRILIVNNAKTIVVPEQVMCFQAAGFMYLQGTGLTSNGDKPDTKYRPTPSEALIPGDWAYMANTTASSNPSHYNAALWGEHLIYLGIPDTYTGKMLGGPLGTVSKTVQGWKEEIGTWPDLAGTEFGEGKMTNPNNGNDIGAEEGVWYPPTGLQNQ